MPIYMGIFQQPNVLDRKFRGGVTAKGFEGWIELESAQVGMHRSIRSPTGRGANREASQPGVQEIVIAKLQDAVSTALFRESLRGEGRLIVIAFVKEDTAYMTLVLQNTLISSYSISGHGGAGHSAPMESFSLNFTNITYEPSPKSPDTTHRSMYDLRQANAA
jgi:type VI secretion system secreted protein Hcp